MAKVYLDSNETFTISENATVVGNSGAERVLIKGTPNVQLSPNIEAIDLAGNTSDYTFLYSASGIQVFSGANPVATLASLNSDITVRFANGSAVLAQTVTGVSLGGTAIPTTTAAAVVPVPASFNTADVSQTSGSGTPQFNASVASTVTEGSTATFNVTLSSAQATSTNVTYALTGTGGAVLGTDTGTATPGNTGTLTFAAGEMVKTITVPVTFDALVETGEGLLLTLSGASTGTALGTAATAATSIANPATPTFTLTSDAVAGTPTQEGKNITFTVTPNGIVDANTTLLVNLTGSNVGSITSQASAADFTSSQTVTFLAGETAARTTSITVVDDANTEGIEGYKAQLLNSTSTEIASTTGLINDPSYTFVLGTDPANQTSVDEGKSITYVVTSDRVAPTGGITIPYTLSGNATFGTDYTGGAVTGGMFTIAAGSKTGTLILGAAADSTTEATAEDITVTLLTPSTGNVTTGKATTVINDTSQGLTTGQISLSTSATAVDEGGAVTYTVTLGTAAPTGGINVPYTLSGTSTLTSDYTGSAATTGNIAVAAGATTGTLTLTTVADNTTEGTETLINTITAPTGYTMVSGKNTTSTNINDTSVAVAGTTFTLTTATDTPTATTSNDTFIALVDAATAANSTLTAVDTLNGLGGNDILNITTQAGTAIPDAVNSALVSNIETINIRGTSTAGVAFNASNAPGVTLINSNLSTDALTLTNVAGTTALMITGNGVAANGAFTATCAASTTNGAITITGGVTAGAVAVNGAGFTSFTVDSTGLANVIGALSSSGTAIAATKINAATAFTTTGLTVGTVPAGGQTLTISGAATDVAATAAAAAHSAVVLGALDADYVSINASGLTAGGVSATLSATTTATFTGGAGNDSLTTSTSAQTGAVDAGTGTDKLVLANSVDIDTVAEGALYKGFEVLQMSNNTSLDMDLITGSTIGAIVMDDAANATAITNMTATQAANVVIAAGAGAMTLGVKGATTVGTLDTLSITVSDGDTTGSEAVAGTGNYTIAGVETINITATDDITISSMANITGLTSLVLKGGGDVSITTAIHVATANESVDFSALTAASTFNFSATTTNPLAFKGGSAIDTVTDSVIGGNVITTYAGADAITLTLKTGGTAADVITGGTGADSVDINSAFGNDAQDKVTFMYATGDSVIDGSVTATGYNNTLMDKVTGIDLANAAAAAAGNVLTFDTAQTATAVTFAATVPTFGTTTVTNAFDFYVFNTGGGGITYAYQDTDGDKIIETGEFGIQLVGVAATATVTGEFTIVSGNLVLTTA